MTNIPLNGRFAIIAGATGGWGPQVAMRLAERGMRLLLLGPDAGRLNELAEKLAGKTPQVFTRCFEPGVPGGLRRVIREAKAWLPVVDVAVCNAAPPHCGPGSQLCLDDVGSDELLSTSDAVELAREFLPQMISSRWGRVVFLAPRLAEREVSLLARACAGRPAFCEVTRRLAGEVGRSRVAVNTIAQSWGEARPARAALREQCRCLGLAGFAQESILTAQAVSMHLMDGGDVPILVEYLLSTDGGRVNGLTIPVASKAAAPAVA